MRLLRFDGENVSYGVSSYLRMATIAPMRSNVQFRDAMDVQTPEIQIAVQQLVMEHGECSPLELLLATNRLGYEDYRAWREGRLAHLDAVLAGGPHEVRT